MVRVQHRSDSVERGRVPRVALALAVLSVGAACTSHGVNLAGDGSDGVPQADVPAEANDAFLDDARGDAGPADEGAGDEGTHGDDVAEVDVPVARCGDGRLDPGEECDDGNAVSGDGCETDCFFSCHAASDCAVRPCRTLVGCLDAATGRRCGYDPLDGEACDDGDDCTLEDQCRAGMCVGARVGTLGTPAPVAPENGALTGSIRAPSAFNVLRPQFRWFPAPDDGGGAVEYEIQVDDSCTVPGFGGCAFASPEAAARGLTEDRWRPEAGLPVSTAAPAGRRYYWRVRARRVAECSAWSAVRYVDVGRVRADFDGDGYSDLLIGAFEQQVRGLEQAGQAFVHYGSPAGLSSIPDLVLDDPTPEPFADVGMSVSAGDLNADGYADAVVSAPGKAGASPYEGKVFLYFGGPGRLAPTPNLALGDPVTGEHEDFGHSVAAGGDVDADGFADLVVGAIGHGDWQGAAFVFRGGADFLAADRVVMLPSPSGEPLAQFGFLVAAAGDLNADGHADVGVGAPWEGDSPDGSSSGRAYIYYGGAAGTPADPDLTLENPDDQPDGGFGYDLKGLGDLDGDGYGELGVGAGWQDSTVEREGVAFVFSGGPSGIAADRVVRFDDPGHHVGAGFGGGFTGRADLDADGHVDVLIGASGQDRFAEDEGSAFLYRGSASGIAAPPSVSLYDPGGGWQAYFGGPIADLGDTNGDGYGDVAIAAIYEPGAVERQGAVFVYHGSASGIAIEPDVTIRNPTAASGAKFGVAID